MKKMFNLFFLFAKKKPASKVPTLLLSPERIQLIAGRLETLMATRKPYLNTRYNIREMAGEINIPSYQLSAYLNQSLGVSFTDYINRFRVEYFQQLVRTNETNQYKLAGLAFKCGFGNRNSLTVAFKKYTGFTPSSYFRTNYSKYVG